MSRTFRSRLIAMVGSTALAFVVVFVSDSLIDDRVDSELARIEQHYLPRAEAAPKLAALFDQLNRGFQDAVAARDLDALAKVRDIRNAFFVELETAHSALDSNDVHELQAAIEDYYSTAHEVSRRLISGETGLPIVEAMTSMQAKRTRARTALEGTTTFDRAELAEAFRATQKAQATARRVQLAVMFASLGLVFLLTLWLSRGALRSLSELAAGFTRFGAGQFDEPITVTASDELAHVAWQANTMAESLHKLADERERAAWIQDALIGLAAEVRGELEPTDVAERSARFVARYVECPCAALFVCDTDGTLRLLGRYGIDGDVTDTVRVGEGIVGQAAREGEVTVIADPPADYLKVSSGLGEGTPRAIILVPLRHGDRLIGVLELASFVEWSAKSEAVVVALRDTVAVALDVARARTETKQLLARAEELAKQLKTGEEKLLSTNEELRTQQEELQQTNEELTRQAFELEQKQRDLEERNDELAAARRGLEVKAQELTTVSAYKSQFLANMSHELRTPLNSMLLLSNLLAENAQGTLTPKQIEYAKTVHAAGNDLLALINQVLDLAKVESGKQEIRVADVRVAKIAEHVERVFAPLAQRKGLRFSVDVSPDVPATLSTDEQRVTQILVNLLGNAVKFTDAGSVELRIEPAAGEPALIAFAVSDTGPGIADTNRERVFAPFEQVDGASDRRHGGTGLGLTIARELATLLGGSLDFESTVGKGTTFTLVLPRAHWPQPAERKPTATRIAPTARTFGDDLATLAPDEEYLLVIEDDRMLAETLGDVIRAQGLRWAGASNGEGGLAMARRRTPSGIILDVKLPGVDGWTVMETLREDPSLATVPVHFLSAIDDPARGAAMGAVGWATKPASRNDLVGIVESLSRSRGAIPSTVLVVAPDGASADPIVTRVAREGLAVRVVTGAEEALQALRETSFGCVVIDPAALADGDATSLVAQISADNDAMAPAIVVHSSKPIDKIQARELEKTATVVLREGASDERLAGEIRSFVRRIREGLAPSRFGSTTRASVDARLEGIRVLLADDDMRTVYALSAALRAKGIEVVVADTGRTAVETLTADPNVDAVLMDVMMPEMDGYEATRRIRMDARFATLPIIALTAKAMKGDRERCLEAGATEYLPKPVDVDRLLVLLGSLVARKENADHAS